MALSIRDAQPSDLLSVSQFWNAKAVDPQSWWYKAPQRSATWLSAAMLEGMELVVAFDRARLVGFGCWRGPNLIGFTADTAEAFYRMMRLWAARYPAERGLSTIPADRTRHERVWYEALQYTAADLTVYGRRMLRRGFPADTNDPLSEHLAGNLAGLRDAIDRRLAAMAPGDRQPPRR